MLDPDAAWRLLKDARALAAAGRRAEAAGRLRSLLLDLGTGPDAKELRLKTYGGLFQVLLADGPSVRLSRIFREAVAEFCTLPDPDFDELYVAGAAATSTSLTPLQRRDRFLFLVQQLDKVQALDGLVAECGCFQGLSSFLMCSRIRRHKPGFDGSGYQIYDSFQGLSEPGAEDVEDVEEAALEFVARDMKKGKFRASLEWVKLSLAAFPRISYFPGWIPAAFAPDNPARYRFVHVDVDLFQPTMDSFEYFWPRLVPGGIVVCDDYKWPGAKRAVEVFCSRQGVPFNVTPATQAWFTRPAA